MDCSKEKSLSRSVPIMEGIDTANGVIDFKGVDFTSQTPSQELFANYDVVLASCGFPDTADIIPLFNRIVVVTNLFMHNLEKVNLYADTINQLGEEVGRYFLVRDVIDMKITPYALSKQIGIDIPEENMIEIYFEYTDYESAILCQYNQVPRFTKITRGLRRYLIEEVMDIYPDLSKKECKKAYKAARKGRA